MLHGDWFLSPIQERERKERFEEAVRQKELKKAEMAQKLVSFFTLWTTIYCHVKSIPLL